MASKRDWVGYANLAANVVQTAQLDGINSKMRQMAELELQNEYRQQHEAAVAKHEDLLREAVFFYSERLRDLEETASQNPAATHIRTCYFRRTYENMPQFKSSGFRKFEDKERLANVQRAYDRMIRECASRLKPDDLQKCDQCIEHIFSRDKLLKLISVQEQLERDRSSLPERQAAKQAELQKVDEQWQQNEFPFWIGLCFVVMAVIVLAIILVLSGISFIESSDSEFAHAGIIVTVLGISVGGILVLLVKAKYWKSEREFAQKVAALKSEIPAMSQAVACKEAELGQPSELSTKFGTAKPEDSKQLLLERDNLLHETLGDFVKEFVERGSNHAEFGLACEVAILNTSAGEMVLEFWPNVAPDHVENFKNLAKEGFYDGTCFHRVIKGFMIQGGDPNTKDDARQNQWGTGGPGYQIKAEFNDKAHTRGVLSMARSNNPDSAGSQFFICHGDSRFLDRQYTAFGKLIKGDDVLEKIATTATEPPDRPVKRVNVESVKIVSADSVK